MNSNTLITKFDDNIVKDIILENLRYMPGISNNVSLDDISINNNEVTIKLHYLENVPFIQIILMTQKSLYHNLSMVLLNKKIKINITVVK